LAKEAAAVTPSEQRTQSHVVRDVIAYRDATRDAERPPLDTAIMLAKRERILDNAAALDDALLELVVTAMDAMEKLRIANPELARRHDR
jgi:hypothetical protein